MVATAVNELSSIDFFAAFSSEERQQILPLLKPESFQAQDIICSEGERADRRRYGRISG